MMTTKKETLTGEQQKPKSDETFEDTVTALNRSWRKQSDFMLDHALECQQARDAFSDRRKEFVAALDHGRSVLGKICAIANTSFLYEAGVREQLPPHYSLIWEFTKMDKPSFEQAIQSGAIHPKITRKEIQAMLPKNAGTKAATSKSTVLQINVDWTIPEYQKPSFQRWLRSGEDQFKSIKVNWPSEIVSIVPPKPVESNADVSIPGDTELPPELAFLESEEFDDILGK